METRLNSANAPSSPSAQRSESPVHAANASRERERRERDARDGRQRRQAERDGHPDRPPERDGEREAAVERVRAAVQCDREDRGSNRKPQSKLAKVPAHGLVMMSHRHIRARRVVPALATLALLGPPASSAAEPPPRPDDTSAAAVYREFIPTAVGARPSAASAPAATPSPSSGSPSSTGSSSATEGVPLTPAASQALSKSGKAVEKTLEQLATSPRYGAPERRLPPTTTHRPTDQAVVAAPSTLGAVATTDSQRLVALALMLLAVTAVLGALALRRNRSGT